MDMKNSNPSYRLSGLRFVLQEAAGGTEPGPERGDQESGKAGEGRPWASAGLPVQRGLILLRFFPVRVSGSENERLSCVHGHLSVEKANKDRMICLKSIVTLTLRPMNWHAAPGCRRRRGILSWDSCLGEMLQSPH